MSDLYGDIPISADQKKASSGAPQTAKKKPSVKSKKQQGDTHGNRKYWIVPLFLFVILAAYYVLSSVFFPVVIKNRLPLLVREKADTLISIETVKFNPLNFSFILGGVSASTSTSKGILEELFQLEEIYLDLDFTSLLRNGLVAKKVVLNNGVLTLRRYKDQTLNISSFFTRDNANSLDTLTFADLPFLYSLNNISIHDSKVIVDDLSTETTHIIKNLQVSLPSLSNFSYNIGAYIQPGFSAVINGNPIELVSSPSANDSIFPGQPGETTRLAVTLQSIDLPVYAKYLPFQLPVQVTKGLANGTIYLSFSTKNNTGRRLTLDYQLTAQNTVFESHDKAISLSAPTLNLEGSLQPLNKEIEISKLLFKDPRLNIRRNISSSSINSLFLDASQPDSEPIKQPDSPSVTVGLLICDNGSIAIETDKQKYAYRAVQLSMKNFANQRALQMGKKSEKNSFSIIGESTTDFSTFSWQGHFANTTPVGKLEVRALPITNLLGILWPDTTTVAKGNAVIQGMMKVKRSPTAPLAIDLQDGTLVLSLFSFEENNQQWLKGSKSRFTTIALQDNTFSVGNIFVEEGDLRIHQGENQPELLSKLFNIKDTSLQGIDFKGDVSLQAKNEKSPSLQLENVHLQLKDLQSKPKQDNFALSASTTGSGSISAKGKIILSPVAGKVEVAMEDVPAVLIFSFLPAPEYQPEKSTTLSGNGSYDMSSKVFNGALEINNGSFKNSKKKRSLKFKKGILGKITCSESCKSIEFSKAAFTDYVYSGVHFDLRADGLTISSLKKTEQGLTLGDIAIPQADLILKSTFSQALDQFTTPGKAKFTMESLQIDGTIFTRDEQRKQNILVESIQASFKDITNSPSSAKNVTLAAKLPGNAAFTGEGSLSVYPLKTQLTMQLADVDIDFFRKLKQRNSALDVATILNGVVTYQYPEKQYSGSVTLKNTVFSNADEKDLFSWNNAKVDQFIFKESPFSLDIDELSLVKPQFNLVQSEKHFLTALSKTLNESLQKENDPASTFQLDIRSLQFADGEIEFTDARLDPPWQSTLSSLDGNITGLTLPLPLYPIEFDLHGQIDSGSFTYAGKFTNSSGGPAETAQLHIDGYPLAEMDDQLAKVFDVNTANSFIDLAYRSEDNPNASEAAFNISFIEAQADSPTTAMTIALLQKENNQISDVLRGDLSDRPLFATIRNHFQKLIIKCSVSPALLLQPPYTKLKDLNSLTFQPGESIISDNARKLLGIYANLLNDYPQLKITLSSTLDSTLETSALRERLESAEKERVRELNTTRLREWRRQHSKKTQKPAVTESIIVEDITEEELNLFTPTQPDPISITDAMLVKLGKDRMAEMRQYLVNQKNVAPDKVDMNNSVILADNLGLSGVGITIGYLQPN